MPGDTVQVVMYGHGDAAGELAVCWGSFKWSLWVAVTGSGECMEVTLFGPVSSGHLAGVRQDMRFLTTACGMGVLLTGTQYTQVPLQVVLCDSSGSSCPHMWPVVGECLIAVVVLVSTSHAAQSSIGWRPGKVLWESGRRAPRLSWDRVTEYQELLVMVRLRPVLAQRTLCIVSLYWPRQVVKCQELDKQGVSLEAAFAPCCRLIGCSMPGLQASRFAGRCDLDAWRVLLLLFPTQTMQARVVATTRVANC
jgi:hypothetical protein